MIKIYIADLQAYNNGELKGEWITLPMCSGELEDFLSEFPSDYAIHDYESPFQINEYTDLYALNEMLEMMEVNKFSLDLLQFVDDLFMDMDLHELREELEEIQVHHYYNPTERYTPTTEQLRADWAMDYLKETGQYDESLLCSEVVSSINWQRVADHLEDSFEIYYSECGNKLYFKHRG